MCIYFVYIVTNHARGTLYTGVTSNLPERALEHREGQIDGFTKRYDLNLLVYYETLPEVHTALLREKQIKRWKRLYKYRLIERMSPEWKDLYPSIAE